MRDDMFKVIVERPRRGSRDKFGAFRNSKNMTKLFEDGVPAKMGTKRLVRYIIGWNTKELNENLQPLERFLRSKIGQKWDDIYSEICSKIDSNSTVQKHVLDHLKDYVEVDERFQNGNRFGMNTWRRWGMYVDANGILCEKNNKRVRYKSHAERRAEELAKRFRKIGDEELWCVDGIWYRPLFKANDKTYINSFGDTIKIWATDIFTGDSVKYGANYRYSKRQADKATLRKFGVENLPQ